MNETLTKKTSFEEVKKSLFAMQKDKAPGLDRFQVGFFQSNWEIIGEDVVEAVVEFLKLGKLLKAWNATFLAMAPKKAATKDLKDFRPISLCNVVYKIITKSYLND